MANRTWHDVVNELTTDPTTGRRVYGTLSALCRATGMPRSTLEATLRSGTSPRGEVEIVRKIAGALGVDPARLFMPDQRQGADREMAAFNEVWYGLLPPERQKLVKALSDPGVVTYLLGCLEGYERARNQARGIPRALTRRVRGPRR